MAKKKYHLLWCYLCEAIGALLLSFGAVIFLSKAELVAGGVSGIAIIIQHFIPGYNLYDLIVAILMVVFWLLGLFFIGWKFSIRTLFSTLLYIGFTALFYRIEFFDKIASAIAGMSNGEAPQVGNYILCGIFGGVFVGSGVALTFLGGGSSGGVDVVQLIISKYTRIKESVSSFIVDGTVIVIGMLTMCINNMELLIPALCGILSSVVTATLIELVYIKNQTSYQVDIISEHWEEISRYAQDELERGATIIRAEGGFKGDERIILRVVFDKSQYEKLREYIASIDPNAFVTFTQTNAVYGEGFIRNKKLKNKKK